jgi:multimeric flavodoxin WrbA
MKLLLINSSARTNGNTGRVMALFEESMNKQAMEAGIALELVRVNLSLLNLAHCLGCRACFDRGEAACPRKDDLLALREQMLCADGYLIASPVYVEDVNGTMKTLIDRMAFTSHRPALYGKTALLFVTSGIGASNHALHTMRTAFGTWGIRVTRGMKFRLGALSAQQEVCAKYDDKIRRAATAFLRVLRQTPYRPSFYSLLAFTVQQSYWRKHVEVQGTYDYQFWNKSGWLDRGRVYYDASVVHSCKVYAARALGKCVALFFG